MRRQALRLAARAVEQRLNADHSGGEPSHRGCACGQLARSAGRREKTFTSALGPLQLDRAYDSCSGCRRHAELEAGKFSDLLRAVRRHADTCDEARKCFQYLQRNRDRLRYPPFEAQGLCTSTGVGEAGCKLVGGTRLKRAGMRGTLRGANAIIALRCSRLSRRFQDFWERRTDARKAA